MKYIGNAFSTNMIPQNAIIKVETIKKNSFMKNRTKSKSIIGHPEIAKLFDLPLNREGITLKKGDELYIVQPSHRPLEHQTVESGTKYQFIPESEGYTYKKITIIE